MAQKPLKKAGKAVKPGKAGAANKHGKSQGTTKKGRLTINPKRAALKRGHSESTRLTKAINTENEQLFAGMAAKNGGRLSVLQAPILATAQEKESKPGSGSGKKPLMKKK